MSEIGFQPHVRIGTSLLGSSVGARNATRVTPASETLTTFLQNPDTPLRHLQSRLGAHCKVVEKGCTLAARITRGQ